MDRHHHYQTALVHTLNVNVLHSSLSYRCVHFIRRRSDPVHHVIPRPPPLHSFIVARPSFLLLPHPLPFTPRRSRSLSPFSRAKCLVHHHLRPVIHHTTSSHIYHSPSSFIFHSCFPFSLTSFLLLSPNPHPPCHSHYRVHLPSPMSPSRQACPAPLVGGRNTAG